METRNRMEEVGSELRTAGRNLWLAGLGAASSVEENSRKLFDDLVERGERWQGKETGTSPLRQAGERVKEATQKVEDLTQA